MLGEETPKTDKELDADKYRFEGIKFQVQSPDTTLSPEVVPQLTGLYAFLKDDTYSDPFKE